MKKKILKGIGLFVLAAIVIINLYNLYIWIVSGNQLIITNIPSKAYTNSEVYMSVCTDKYTNNDNLKIKMHLLDGIGKRVKKVNFKYDGSNVIMEVPDIKSGNYTIKTTITTKKGKDTFKKPIYLTSSGSNNVTITFDKGIYKPGDTVNYRALITNTENDEPLIKKLNVSIYDGNKNRVYNEDITSSEYGIVSGEFSLANEVNSGLYKLVVKTEEGETTKEFKVNPYVIPKYEVKIKTDKDKYLVGEKAQITFNAKYFFGEAAKDTTLKVYINNSFINKTLKTNDEGEAFIEFDINEAKKYTINVEAVDSSNYYVEATGSFVAGTDLFEVQVLPEYGNLVRGVKNDVYVLTKKADGTPIKTYITVNSDDNYTKQIMTDQNGIGKFSIDITSNEIRKKSFSFEIRDTEDNVVRKELDINIDEKLLVIATDKVKYEQGEDIELKMSNLSLGTKNIYVLKGDRVIKTITTDSANTTINLDDTYGLIDIYVTDSINNEKNYYSYKQNSDMISSTKTIFIKPKKQLTIGITTDKDEYRPGEKINISFDAKDENKSGVDAALLVSMLDNSILSLAENDLSIDNIKLALNDIKFSDKLDAATFYSCIIDENSEQTMMALLLKQNRKANLNLSIEDILNYQQEDRAKLYTIITGAVLLIIAFVWFFKTNKFFRRIMGHLPLLLVLEVFIAYVTDIVIFEFFWRIDGEFLIITGMLIFGLAFYILWLSKHNKKLVKTSLALCLAVGIAAIYDSYYIDLPIGPIIVISSVIFLITVLVWKFGKDKYPRVRKIAGKIIGTILYLVKFTPIFVFSVWATYTIADVLELEFCSPLIFIIYIYFFDILTNKIINRILKKENTVPEETEKEKPTSKDIIITTIFIIIIVIILFSFIVNDFVGFGHNSISEAGSSLVYDDTSSAKSSSSKSQFSEMRVTNTTKDGSAKENYTQEPSKQDEKNDKSEENVRSVFLESMCFIPELVINNGSGNVDLKLSDNITTWTIQTIGNTKDGRIGYGSIDNVKVFKEFFVDFELPKNMVEGDNISVPVTVYNYTKDPITTTIKVREDKWFKIDNNNINIRIEPNSTNMVYVPIAVLKFGDNEFRVEISNDRATDIVEKSCTVSPKGYKVEKVVSTGNLGEDISEDILLLEDVIENTAKAKVKIYPSTISKTIEGMDKIFKMPTGCFEQVSSSLYPDIVALKYMEDNDIIDEELKAKALSYISAGYQKLLTYEVVNERGGFSLYGKSPAETVLTAYGLMELTDLKDVYNVDNDVLDRMTKYLYGKQKSNGSFTLTGFHIGGAGNEEELSLNAYITWALSESNPKDERLKRSVDYLKEKLDEIEDNYTLALIANILANTGDKDAKDVIKTLVNSAKVEKDVAYLTSEVHDYYGSKVKIQTIQTVALTSMALSKTGSNNDTNKLLINYLIRNVDIYGTWYSTQATTLALRALNQNRKNTKIDNQTIKVKFNSDEQKAEIGENTLDYYEFTFENLSKENKLDIDIEKGNACYEVVEEYYIPYNKVDTKENSLEVSIECNNDVRVNDILTAKIKLVNISENNVKNGMVTISIPQGFTTIEESLAKLESKGLIEKYEMSYTAVNIYLKDFNKNDIVSLDVQFRASYPVDVTGMAVRAYDYYNPSIEGMTMPIPIRVIQ